MKEKTHSEKIKALVGACCGTFIWLWMAVLNYVTRVNRLLLEIDISGAPISDYSVSVIQTKITTAHLEEYRVINWSFPLLVLLGVLILALVHKVNHDPEDRNSDNE